MCITTGYILFVLSLIFFIFLLSCSSSKSLFISFLFFSHVYDFLCYTVFVHFFWQHVPEIFCCWCIIFFFRRHDCSQKFYFLFVHDFQQAKGKKKIFFLSPHLFSLFLLFCFVIFFALILVQCFMRIKRCKQTGVILLLF